MRNNQKGKPGSSKAAVIELGDDSTPSNGIVNGDSRSSSPLECTFQENDMFIIDTEGCEEHENKAFVPTVDGEDLDLSNVCSHLDTPEPEKKKKRGPQCFNCSGDHQLNDCPEPRDNRRISRNRNSFRSSFQSGPRLHQQQENGTNYEPGVISDSLREALGIGPNDIPEWIYRMRKKGFIDGYPPAYLKRAIEKNVLNFIVSDADPMTSQSQDALVIDPKKIIAYVGFNKEDKNMNDLELPKFKVPPWDMFIAAHQRVLDGKAEIRASQLKEEDRAQKKKSTPSGPLNVFEQRHGGGSRTKSPKKQKYQHKGSPPPERMKRRKVEVSLEEGEIEEGEERSPEAEIVLSDDDSSESGEDLIEVDSVIEEAEEVLEVTNRSKIESTSRVNGVVSMVQNGNATPGPSKPISVTMGTPIMMSKLISADKMNHEVLKPTLDNFSKDILPFRHTNEVQTTGFFKKLQGFVKSLRKGKDEPKNEENPE